MTTLAPVLPDLRIVETKDLLLHERVDGDRVRPLVEALEREGVLKNPPVVLEAEELGGKYVVLDGANRTEAFRSLRLPHILVQCVDPAGGRLRVETWNHVLLDGSAADLVDRLHLESDLELCHHGADEAPGRMSARSTAAYLGLPDGSVWEVAWPGSSVEDRLMGLDRMIGLYQGGFRVERTSADSARGLEAIFRGFSCLVVFPRFDVEEVVSAAAQGLVFPSGLTRFLVSPRALRVNYPLARLAAQESVGSKAQQLELWLQEKVEARRIRYYEESTFLFDE